MTVWEQARLKGYSRRDFLRFCSWLAVAAGIPRGALAHWIVIKDRKIENYQLVVPSTWNASPRDSKGQMSAYEAALIGTPVANPEQPWSCSGRSTPSTPAWPAPSTSTTPAAATSTKWPSSRRTP
jgi:hypothetical protein